MLIGGLDNAATCFSPLAKSPWLKTPTHLLPRTPFGLQARHYHHKPSPAPTKTQEQKHSLPTTSHPDLPHLTASQTVHMTQINEKPITARQATSTCHVHFSNPRPYQLLATGQGTHKGDVYSVARIAGITAAKKTPDIVPLCHPGLGITGVEVEVTLVEPARPQSQEQEQDNQKDESAKTGPHPEPDHGAIRIVASVGCIARTGVEMEAMTATMGAALTVYDMLKAVDKGMVIGGVKLLEKTGGKSGRWVRESES